MGGSSIWKTPVAGSSNIYPRYWLTYYTITFSTDCLINPVNLAIASTGYFQIYLNGSLIEDWQSPWPSITRFQFAPLCGCNKLTVIVWSYWWSSPSAIIYSLTQNTAGCYDCPNLGATFYNRDTCRCECSATGCLNSAMTLSASPSCSCQCSPQRSDSYCKYNQFWNMQTCSCQCKKACCKSG